MSETKKLYAVCLRKTCLHDWTLAINADTGEPIAVTISHLVDVEFGEWLKEPEIFEKVTLKDFREELKNDLSNSKYVKKFGWKYAETARLLEKDGAVFVLTIHPKFESRVYSFVQSRDDNDYAFQLLQDIYAIRGGQIILEEFDPEKHVKGYKPNI